MSSQVSPVLSELTAAPGHVWQGVHTTRLPRCASPFSVSPRRHRQSTAIAQRAWSLWDVDPRWVGEQRNAGPSGSAQPPACRAGRGRGRGRKLEQRNQKVLPSEAWRPPAASAGPVGWRSRDRNCQHRVVSVRALGRKTGGC